MNHTEAADLILSEADAPPMDWYLPEVRDAILATVATVMDAARADALEEAAEVADGVKYPPEYREHYEIAERAGFDLALEYTAAAIRAHAKHREPKS